MWFHQRVGQCDNFIGFIEGWGEPYEFYVKRMQETRWVWGVHYLPHDGNHVRQGMENNLSPLQMLEELGLRNIEIVPRVPDLSHGIQATRRAFSTCWFDEEHCKDGIVHLDNYKKKWNNTAGRFMDQPEKDVHTEAADAFRQFAQAREQEELEHDDYDDYHETGRSDIGGY